jgi:hypothetical protein
MQISLPRIWAQSTPKNSFFTKAGKGFQGLIHYNDVAIQVQGHNPDGDFIQQFEKIDRNIEKVVDARRNCGPPARNNPNRVLDIRMSAMTKSLISAQFIAYINSFGNSAQLQN